MTIKILIGDCRVILRSLPDESVHCVATSPPYFGLRDYGVAGQIGLEASPAAYVAQMVAVFREVRRVLRKDGTCWLNLGDSYVSAPPGNKGPINDVDGAKSRVGKSGNLGHDGSDRIPRTAAQGGLKPKDMVGIPWRVAFALQADGWWLRQDIIWSKPNPMPESVTDRCTKAHEYIFLMTKAERYFYDADAIKEEAEFGRRDTAGAWRGGAYVNQKGPQDNSNGSGLRNSVTGKHPETGRNKRSVWTVATAPYSEAHFATFPPALIEPCILAGCPAKCCAKCGAPWVRETSITRTHISSYNGRYRAGFDNTPAGAPRGFKDVSYKNTETLGFSPSCSCDAGTVAGTCLDPFSGAGTTGLVADRLQRNAIMIDLSANYAAMSERRITGDAPLFAEVSRAI